MTLKLAVLILALTLLNASLTYALFLGDRCLENDECTDDSYDEGVSFSMCQGGICQCLPEYVQREGGIETCFPRRTIGRRCIFTGQCPTNGICLDRVCRCEDEFLANLENTACEEVEPLDLNVKCRDSKQCSKSVTNSECKTNMDGNLTCQCQQNYIPNENRCLKVADKLADPCEIDNQCENIPSIESKCNKEQGFCDCLDTHVANDDYTQCFEKKYRLNESCDIEKQCQPVGSNCRDGACQCSDNLITHEPFDCLKRINDIDVTVCKTNGQCPLHSRCAGDPSKCICEDGFVVDSQSRSCLPVIKSIGGECSDSNQCSSMNALCEGPVCSCPSTGYVPTDIFCHREINTLGVICDVENQCKVQNANCIEGEPCDCIEGFVGKNSTCYKELDLGGDPCDIDEQCPIDSACNAISGQRQCTCNDNYVSSENNKTCLRAKYNLNESCLETAQCFVPNSHCLNSMCSCNTAFVAEDNRCLPEIYELGEACETPSQCKVVGSTCYNGTTCACDANHREKDGVCYKILRLENDVCQIEEQCPFNSNCASIGDEAEKLCRCTDDFISSEDKSICLKVQYTIGAECLETPQCNMTNTECREGTCQCSSGFVKSSNSNICLNTRPLGQPCTEDAQCALKEKSERAQCAFNKCQCRKGFLPQIKENVCSSGVEIAASAAAVLWHFFLSLFFNRNHNID